MKVSKTFIKCFGKSELTSLADVAKQKKNIFLKFPMAYVAL